MPRKLEPPLPLKERPRTYVRKHFRLFPSFRSDRLDRSDRSSTSTSTLACACTCFCLRFLPAVVCVVLFLKLIFLREKYMVSRTRITYAPKFKLTHPSIRVVGGARIYDGRTRIHPQLRQGTGNAYSSTMRMRAIESSRYDFIDKTRKVTFEKLDREARSIVALGRTVSEVIGAFVCEHAADWQDKRLTRICMRNCTRPGCSGTQRGQDLSSVRALLFSPSPSPTILMPRAPLPPTALRISPASCLPLDLPSFAVLLITTLLRALGCTTLDLL